MYGLTRVGTLPQQAQQMTGLYGLTAQQAGGIDITTLLNMMIPLIMVVMMMKMAFGAFGSSGSKMKPVKSAS